MEIKPFLMAFFILATIVATLSPVIDASSVANEEGGRGFFWSPYRGNQCNSRTWWGRRVCRSRGLTCCKHKCVNLKQDKANCGSCGSVCHYNAECCGGKCINVMSNNAYHCGGCNKKCPINVKCTKGVCGYAS